MSAINPKFIKQKGGGASLHALLPDLQGGSAGEYYHLTAAEYAVVAGGSTLAGTAGEDLLKGDPVYYFGGALFKADSSASAKVIGLMGEDTLNGAEGSVITEGPITLSGLTPDSTYYLGVEEIVTTVPTTGFVVPIGESISATVLVVNIRVSVELV